jgi:uncharacterized protein (TIRG00374 family)
MSRLGYLRIAVVAALVVSLAWALTHTDTHKILDAFRGINWGWAIWVPIINLLNTWVAAVRLALILSPVKKGARVRNAMVAILLGVLGNAILPFRFGDGARAYILATRESVSLSSGVSAVMVDRIVDLIFFFSLVAFTALLYPFPSSVKRASFLMGGLFGAILVVLLILTRYASYLGERFGGRYGRRIMEEAGRAATEISTIRSSGLLGWVGLLTFVSWTLKTMMIWVMFLAFQLSLPIWAPLVTLVLLNLGIAVSGVPANLASFEVSIVAALQLFSVDLGIALSYAVALHVIEGVPIVVLALILLWLGGYRSKGFRDDGPEARWEGR